MCTFFKFIYEGILKTDMIGPYPELSHYGNKRYSTFLGAVLSLGVIALVLWLYNEDFSDVINEEFPASYSQLKPNPTPMLFDKDVHNQTFIQIKYYNTITKTFNHLDVADFPKIKITEVINENEVVTEKGTGPAPLKDVQYLTACPSYVFQNYSDLVNGNKPNETYIKFMQTNSLCFPENTNVTLGMKDDISTSLSLSVFYKDIQNLKAKYNTPGLFLTLVYPEILVKPFDKPSPFIQFWKEFLFQIEFDRTKISIVHFKRFVGETDKTKFIVPDKKTILKYFIDAYETILDMNNEHTSPDTDISLTISIVIDNTKFWTSLKYMSVDTILSNLGGSLGFIFPIVELIYTFFLTPFYQASRINHVFNFHTNLDSNDKIDKLIKEFKKNFNTETGNSGISGISGNSDKSNSNEEEIDPSDEIQKIYIEAREDKSSHTKDDILQLNNKNNNEHSVNEIKEVALAYNSLSSKENNNDINVSSQKNLDDLDTVPKQTLPNQNSNKNIKTVKKESTASIELSRRNINNNNNIEYCSNSEKEQITPCTTKESLQQVINSRKKFYISCLDLQRNQWFCCCQYPRKEVVEKTLQFLDASLDESALAVEGLRLKMFMKFLLNRHQKKVFKIPFTNMNIKRKFFLDEIFQNDLEEDSEEFQDKAELQTDLLVNLGIKDEASKGMFDNYLRSFL